MNNLIKTKVFGISLFLIILITLVSASFYMYSSQSDFNLGTYNNTLYNASVGSGVVQLNLTYNNGTYTSQIFNTGSNVSLNNLSWTYQRIQCPANMSYINKLRGFCIDQYEAVALNADGSWNDSSDDNGWVAASTTSLLAAGGYAGSMSGKYPWVYISANQARTACSSAGKHLCTDEEWLASANYKGNYYNLPATISNCTVSSNCILGLDLGPNGGDACYGGAMANCTSSEGVYDLTGNVWEWTNETIEYTKPCEPVGTSGYCYWNGTTFLNITNAQTAVFGNDGMYFLDNLIARSNYAVRRGGDWVRGALAGPFCGALHSAPTDTDHVIGFRCCS